MNSNSAKQHRQLRVFISSTFADMNDERDALIRVFPQFKERCKERNVEFVPIDLRWGITEDAAKQGRVIETCMREIDNSRPFFIGIIGNRYGWIPQEADLGSSGSSIRKQFPWIYQALSKGMSITEMEMQYAALNQIGSTQPDINAAFFLRSDKIDVAPNFRETAGSERERKLQGLKDKIRRQQQFAVHEYESLQQLCDTVLKELTEFLNREYPRHEVESYESTIKEQEALLSSRSTPLFDISRHDNVLRQWINDPSKRWLTVSGYADRGKSYILARFVNILRSQSNNPAVIYCDWQNIGDTDSAIEYILVELLNALGVRTRKQSEKAEMFGCLGSLFFMMIKTAFQGVIAEFKWALGNQDQNNLGEQLASNMSYAVATSIRLPMQKLSKELRKKPKRQLFVALDNMDDMTSQDLVLLNMLSDYPYIRFICSASVETKAMVHLQSVLNSEILKIGNLDRIQSQQYITNYLAQFGKSLDEEGVQRNKIVNSAIGGAPVLLSHILSLLVNFGSFEEIDRYINELASVKNSQQVYELLIRGIMEQFPDNQGSHAAAQALAALTLVPSGLTEEEIKEIINPTPLEWAMVRPYVLNMCKMRGNEYFLPSATHHNAVKTLLSEYVENVADKVIAYFEKLLTVYEIYTDSLGNSDFGKIYEQGTRLNRQVKVLPQLYAAMGRLPQLYDWVTYILADIRLSESERIEYWRVLFNNGYTMRKAPHRDMPPYLKRMRCSVPEMYNRSNKRELVQSTKKDADEMYNRWSYIAGLFHQAEDIAWLSQQLSADGLNKTEIDRTKLYNHIQLLYTQQKYDEVIALGTKESYDDIYQIIIDGIVAMAYKDKGDLDSAFYLFQSSMMRIDMYQLTYDDSFDIVYAILPAYSDVACQLNKQETIEYLIPIMEYHRDKLLPLGIDNMRLCSILMGLAHIYHQKGRDEEALKTAELWQQSATALKLPSDNAKEFINKMVQAGKSS